MTENKLKVALYARVSKAQEQTPENQLIELRRYVKSCGYEPYGEYVDEISTRNTRPRKVEVLQEVRARRIDGVVFWSLDRWGRDMAELVLEMDEFHRKGFLMISIKENIDLTTSAGRLHAQIIAAFAMFERSRIRERTILGLRRARETGTKLGRPRGSRDIRKRKKRVR